MKIPATRTGLLALLALSLSAGADTFFLKDGTKLDAKVISEDTESYTLEVQVTPTIKDERVVAKADVEKIEREKLDLTAFEKIKDLVPTPDLLTSDEYDARILPVTKFLKEYPRSSKAKDAQVILDTLKKEAEAVAQGGIKLDGNIVEAAEFQSNAFEMDARVGAAKVRAAAAKSDWLGALREFEKLEPFQSTAVYRDLLPVVSRVLASYKAVINEWISTREARVATRRTDLDRMSPDDKANTLAALREEAAGIDARYAREKSENLRWVTPHPFHANALSDNSSAIENELQRIEHYQAPQTDGGKAYRDAWAAIHSEADPAEITAALNNARSAGLPEEYTARLDAAAKAAGATEE